ncbi:Syntaxin-5 [Hypsibius exemplaris]|uniref:Syntaxin-5 n=1 Tax=Hypsibius exemplaris TaxID=2072580 RepID=A0A1W0WV20_HYPEX|nr:Syntaxin-5 [Hypsibius exemplaris]
MSKDRTHEFASIVQHMQQNGRNGFTPSSPAAGSSTKQKQAAFAKEFSRCSREISKDLAVTCAKLEKLTILSKSKTIFDDRGLEIEHLSHQIKDDMQHLNEQINKLQQLSRTGSSSVPTTRHHHLEDHTKNVVFGLQSKLAKASSSFKGVLEIRTENMKHQQERREKYSSSGPANEYVPSRPPNSILLQDELSRRGDSPVTIDMSQMDLTRRTTPQQQMMLIEEQDKYIQSRETEVQNIESTIVELGGIFAQLAHMVKEQEEVVQRIDMHVEEADTHIEAAHDELLRYFRSISSNRWLMAKVFGILILFFLFGVIFLA